MKKVVAILGFIVVTGAVIPDASLAHKHIFGPPERQSVSLTPIEHEVFIGPVQRSESLSEHTEHPAWHGITLIHPDPQHLRGSEPHRPAFYRDNDAPGGTAVMFSWRFGRMGSQTTPDHNDAQPE